MLLLLALIGCAEDPYVLDGVWTGYVECSGAGREAWELRFAADGDEGEYSAPAEAYDFSFTLRVEIPGETSWEADSVSATADADDCFDADGAEWECWSVSATVGPASDTMNGGFTNFPISPGTCTWDLQRPFYP
ncbi:MAG: hypothetical protein H6741_03370 [Alphaproteobacteria bacterium]|nr:hypothetical protein [Alphaproteobacteria bacterium]